MHYRIEWHDNAHTITPRLCVSRKRRDSFLFQLYSMARQMVASWGGLDTEWGWQFMREIMAHDFKPKKGELIEYCHKLHHGDCLRIYVEN